MAALRSLLLSFALFPLALAAQNIGINADGGTPNTSAMLDIDVSAITGTKRGLLIPRVTTTERNAIPAPATSLLIFNTSTVQFEYFDGTIWRGLLNTASAGWGLTGNAGTNSATNFIGTTDAQPLRFRAGNGFAGQLSNTATGLVSYGLSAGAANTGGSNTFIGSNAGAANTTGTNNTYLGTSAGSANIAGQQNVFIGRLAGGSATGSDNILIGNGAGISNAANNNVMIGSFAGNANSTGGGNTFVGTQAGAANGTGGQNTFIGSGAGSSVTTGQGLTLLGNSAGVGSSALTNSAAIGFQARADQSNSVILGSVSGVNGATTTVNVGIGTSSPLDRLHVAGSIRMVDGNQAANRVMVSDANGTASWQTLNTATTNAWGLSGNFGTNAGNFIGTTDNVPFTIRTFGQERISVLANGRVEVGGSIITPLFSSGPAKVLVASEVNGEENLTVWAAHNAAGGRASITLARQRGSFVAFNPVVDNDGLGELLFDGYATGTHVRAASITCDVDGTPSLLSVPGQLSFATTPVGLPIPLERMTIRSTGDMGIGTNTPDRHAEVEGTAEQYLRITSTSGSSGITGIELKRQGNGPSDWQIRNEGGLLLFGQSADDLTTVNDVLRLGGGSTTPAVDNTITLGQASLRWTNVFATSGVVNTSDAREKMNIRTIDRGLAEVMRLKPVRFQWKDRPAEGDKLGLIAQDLQQVLPETVVDKTWKQNEDGTREQVPAERLGVYYSDLIPVLIKAIQEQQAEIDALRQEIETLKR